MTSSIYEAVVMLVEQLSDDEQQALMTKLVEKQHKPSTRDWMARLESVMISKLGPLYSDSREDWYSDHDD
jgi:hypothetical protein